MTLTSSLYLKPMAEQPASGSTHFGEEEQRDRTQVPGSTPELHHLQSCPASGLLVTPDRVPRHWRHCGQVFCYLQLVPFLTDTRPHLGETWAG